MSRQTKGSIEAAVANAVVKFQREQHGRGPTDVRAHILGDLVIVRCNGIFTQTEARLAQSEDGRKLIRSARKELRNISGEELELLIAQAAGCSVVRSYSDVNVEAAEQIEVFVLSVDIDKRLLREELDQLSGLAPRRSA